MTKNKKKNCFKFYAFSARLDTLAGEFRTWNLVEGQSCALRGPLLELPEVSTFVSLQLGGFT